MITSEGHGKGFITTNYAGAGNGVPLLSSFYFKFDAEKVTLPTFPPTVINPNPTDNHLNEIRVLPGGVSEDLASNPDVNPAQVANGKIELNYADDTPTGPRDRYFYKMAHHSLLNGRVRRFQFRDVGGTGKIEQMLPPPPSSGPGNPFESIFALVGFRMFYTGDRDHEIDAIGVYEDNRKLTVEFNDKNDDDVFGYVVDYAWVQRRPPLNIQLGEESGTNKIGARVELPAGQKVIRGFRFDFRSGDHDLMDIGVVTGNRRLEVFFSDRESDKSFNWMVRWANIGTQGNNPG